MTVIDVAQSLSDLGVDVFEVDDRSTYVRLKDTMICIRPKADGEFEVWDDYLISLKDWDSVLEFLKRERVIGWTFPIAAVIRLLLLLAVAAASSYLLH